MHFPFCNFCRAADEMKKEARMCILDHDNIVALFAIVSEIGHYGIVMEYVPNGPLGDFIYIYNVCCTFPDLFGFVHI